MVENATVPVIETGVGNCHIYVDAAADIGMAASIAVNAKASRPSVCNAAETLLVHEAIAGRALPVIAAGMKQAGVQLRGCEKTRAILNDPAVLPAAEEDWATEYLDYIMVVRVSPRWKRPSITSPCTVPVTANASSPTATPPPSASPPVWTRPPSMSTPPPASPTAGVRHGRGNRHLHPEAHARGPDGTAGADHGKIHRLRQRTDPIRLSPEKGTPPAPERRSRKGHEVSHE